MIKIEKEEVYGWETAIRGMRNPLNSWSCGDSHVCGSDDCAMIEHGDNPHGCNDGACGFCIGIRDMRLMLSLVEAGSDHSKFMRMINVTVDITAPLYWWKEVDQYRIGVTTNSCSTMHKIAEREFKLDDFSHEHLFDDEDNMAIFKSSLSRTIADLNTARNLYVETKDKKYWWQMIQLLPSSYNQRRTVQLNYAVLRNMYHARKNHKLDEWREFCAWIEMLPYSELLKGE